VTIANGGCSGGMRARLALGVVAVMLLLAAPPVRADPDDQVDPGDYTESLDPYGAFVDDAQLGRVWRPSVWWEWRPYVDGRWIWTTYGWTWASAEPWAWTFHYGRWGFSNVYGWVWTPGAVWGPAWVDWYWGDGFIGWTPLGPPGAHTVGYWTYVHDYHFCSPRLTTVVVEDRFLPDYVVHHSDRGLGRERPPEFRDVELVTRHPIERQSDRPNDSIAPWMQRRLEHGDEVRERVADRNGERVIEHPPRTVAAHPERPAVADDGGWRRAAPPPPAGSHVIPQRGPEDVAPRVPGGPPEKPYMIEPHNGRWDGTGDGRQHEWVGHAPGGPNPRTIDVPGVESGVHPQAAPPANGGAPEGAKQGSDGAWKKGGPPVTTPHAMP
jgi:hypothetical protein